ncbi:MAG TPA: T9SS type A sorting domain-containing protein [Bacteroidales bacterium]|nr:T9SS type A sorting domain-containing protein [Bacteroidales bacterium]
MGANTLYQLTNEIVYDYQAGDEFQYYDYYNNSSYPGTNYKRYKKYKILNRTITADSLFYSAIYEWFNADSTNLFVDTIMLKYSRNTLIANIPFEKYNGQESRTLGIKDYCGLRLWTFEKNRLSYYNEYSLCDTSWCYNSEPGPPVYYKSNYVSGLGLYLDQSYYISPFPPNGNWGKELRMIYFKKNGISCGAEMFAGIKEYQDKDDKLIIGPNPAIGYIHITSSVLLRSITLFTIEGQELLSQNLSGTAETIDVRNFHNGIFVARICFNDNTVAIKKIVIFND